LRLALADGFLAAGDRARALIMVEGMSGDAEAARRLVQSGRPTGQAIDTLAKAYAEALATFAADVARMQRGTPPIGLVQVARYINPDSSSTALLLALLLHSRDRSTEALTLLRTFPADDALVSHIRDTQSKIFTATRRRPMPMAGRLHWRGLRAATAICGRCCCCGQTRWSRQVAGRKRGNPSSRRWRWRRSSRCCSISSATASWSAARTSMPPKP
jgi:hypothetical protein